MTLVKIFETETYLEKPYPGYFPNIGEYKKALDEWKDKYIEWLEKQIPQWIDINTEKPKEKTPILYADVFGHVSECRYSEWVGFSSHAITINGVSHWMNLPQHPNKRGTEAEP